MSVTAALSSEIVRFYALLVSSVIVFAGLALFLLTVVFHKK